MVMVYSEKCLEQTLSKEQIIDVIGHLREDDEVKLK